MEDSRIVDMYLNRDEQAVACAQARYGAYCEAIARRILGDRQDAEECVNAAWLAAWNSIPPQKPRDLKGYLAKLVRRISLDACRKRDAVKRGGGERAAALEELGDCLAGGETVKARMENRMLAESICRKRKSVFFCFGTGICTASGKLRKKRAFPKARWRPCCSAHGSS